jgi:hypothetical protein
LLLCTQTITYRGRSRLSLHAQDRRAPSTAAQSILRNSEMHAARDVVQLYSDHAGANWPLAKWIERTVEGAGGEPRLATGEPPRGAAGGGRAVRRMRGHYPSDESGEYPSVERGV